MISIAIKLILFAIVAWGEPRDNTIDSLAAQLDEYNILALGTAQESSLAPRLLRQLLKTHLRYELDYIGLDIPSDKQTFLEPFLSGLDVLPPKFAFGDVRDELWEEYLALFNEIRLVNQERTNQPGLNWLRVLCLRSPEIKILADPLAQVFLSRPQVMVDNLLNSYKTSLKEKTGVLLLPFYMVGEEAKLERPDGFNIIKPTVTALLSNSHYDYDTLSAQDGYEKALNREASPRIIKEWAEAVNGAADRAQEAKAQAPSIRTVFIYSSGLKTKMRYVAESFGYDGFFEVPENTDWLQAVLEPQIPQVSCVQALEPKKISKRKKI